MRKPWGKKQRNPSPRGETLLAEVPLHRHMLQALSLKCLCAACTPEIFLGSLAKAQDDNLWKVLADCTMHPYSNSINTISGRVPTRMGGPHVPAPVVV